MIRMLLLVVASPVLLLQPPMDSADQPPPADRDLLRGPEAMERATLLRFDFTGALIPPEGRPEEAAVALVVDDPDRRRQAIAAAEARLNDLSQLLVDRVDLVREATDAIAAGDQVRAREIQGELYDTFEPDHPRDPLLVRLESVLEPAEYEEVVGLLDEYWTSRIDWELRAVEEPTPEQRLQVERGLVMALFQRDLTLAYNASLRPYRERLEVIYAIAEPGDDQRVAIRDVVLEFIQSSGLHPTAEQRAALARDLYAVLDEEQRHRVLEYLLWRR
jgi:hypothetical protein